MQILSLHFECQFPAIHIPDCLLVSLFVLPSQAVSPDGEAIVTGAGDETLRFWNVFSKTRCTKVECICLLQCDISIIYSSDAFGCLKLLNSILKVILSSEKQDLESHLKFLEVHVLLTAMEEIYFDTFPFIFSSAPRNQSQYLTSSREYDSEQPGSGPVSGGTC